MELQNGGEKKESEKEDYKNWLRFYSRIKRLGFSAGRSGVVCFRFLSISEISIFLKIFQPFPRLKPPGVFTSVTGSAVIKKKEHCSVYILIFDRSTRAGAAFNGTFFFLNPEA